MQLSIINQQLEIRFEWYEQLFGVCWNSSWVIPLANIKEVKEDDPVFCLKEIRAPGSYIPGYLKAGTYYGNRGKEFWYVTDSKNYLTLELQNESYQRIILTLPESNVWAMTIREAISY